MERSELKGNSSTGRMRHLLFRDMFNLRIKERFLTTRVTEHLSSQHKKKTTKKYPPLSLKFLKGFKLYVVETQGNWECFYVLMKYNCLQESPNTDFKPVVWFR